MLGNMDKNSWKSRVKIERKWWLECRFGCQDDGCPSQAVTEPMAQLIRKDEITWDEFHSPSWQEKEDGWRIPGEHPQSGGRRTGKRNCTKEVVVLRCPWKRGVLQKRGALSILQDMTMKMPRLDSTKSSCDLSKSNYGDSGQDIRG